MDKTEIAALAHHMESKDDILALLNRLKKMKWRKWDRLTSFIHLR